MLQESDTERPGIDTMVLGIVKDVQILVRQEMALAKHEIQYELAKLTKAIMWYGIAAVLAVIGLFVIAATCVLILFEYTGLPAWVCAAIVSVVFLASAAGVFVAGRGMASSVRIAPLRTVRTLTDDVKWMAEWVRARFV